MGRRLYPISRRRLNEASIGRIFQHVQNKDCFGIITAFRGSNSLKENQRRNEKLEQEIKRLRFGFNKVKGYYVENGKEPVIEESFIVYSSSDRDEELINFLKSACKEFEQECFLLVLDGVAELWDSKGSIQTIGDFHPTPSMLGSMYSRIKNKPFRFGDPVDVEESALIEVHPIEESRRGVSESAVYLYRRKILLQEGSNYFQSLREDERERRERWNRRYSR